MGKKLQSKQQEQRPGPEVRSGQDGMRSNARQLQPDGVGSGGSTQRQQKRTQEQKEVSAGGGAGQAAPAAAAPSVSKRQPTAASAPSGNIPRGRGLDMQDATKGGQGTAGMYERAAARHGENAQKQQRQVSHAPLPGSGRTAAVTSLLTFARQIPSSRTSTDVSNSYTATTPRSSRSSSASGRAVAAAGIALIPTQLPQFQQPRSSCPLLAQAAPLPLPPPQPQARRPRSHPMTPPALLPCPSTHASSAQPPSSTSCGPAAAPPHRRHLLVTPPSPLPPRPPPPAQ